jgi:hypothetical protein
MYIEIGEIAYNFDQVISIRKTDGFAGPSIYFQYDHHHELIRCSSEAARDDAYLKLLNCLGTKYLDRKYLQIEDEKKKE